MQVGHDVPVAVRFDVLLALGLEWVDMLEHLALVVLALPYSLTLFSNLSFTLNNYICLLSYL